MLDSAFDQKDKKILSEEFVHLCGTQSLRAQLVIFVL